MIYVKYFLIGVGVLLFLAVVSLGAFFYFSNKGASEKSLKIDRICEVEEGTSVEEVMNLSRELGFDNTKEEFAVPSQIEIRDSDKKTETDSLPHIKLHDSDLESDLKNFKNGEIIFSLSLFLFERKGCVVTFKDRKVVSTRKWFLD